MQISYPSRLKAPPPPGSAPSQKLKASLHLIERCHALGQLRLYLRQGLCLLQCLLQLLLGVVQPLGQLTALFFTLGDNRDRG